MQFAAWIELEAIMLIEVSQKERNRYIISHLPTLKIQNKGATKGQRQYNRRTDSYNWFWENELKERTLGCLQEGDGTLVISLVLELRA